MGERVRGFDGKGNVWSEVSSMETWGGESGRVEENLMAVTEAITKSADLRGEEEAGSLTKREGWQGPGHWSGTRERGCGFDWRWSPVSIKEIWWGASNEVERMLMEVTVGREEEKGDRGVGEWEGWETGWSMAGESELLEETLEGEVKWL